VTSPPDFAEPVVGFRAWRVDAGVLVPWSAGAAGAWEPGVNTARCLHRRHAAPATTCSCGLYALASAEDDRLRPHHEAVGAIVAWGDVELHRTGFRAEHAAIVALALPDDCPARHADDLRAAAVRYGVPLVPPDQLVAAACEHGRPIAYASAPATARQPASPNVPRLDQRGLSGTAADDHVELTIVSGGVRIAPTPELAAAAGDDAGRVPLAIDGASVSAGDLVLRLGDDEEALLVRTPLSGAVIGTDRRGVLVAPSAWEREAVAVDWGSLGRRRYADALRDLARRGDPFADARTRWIRAMAGIRSAADVRDALRELRDRPRFATDAQLYETLGARLKAALTAPEALAAAARLPLRIQWRLHHPDAAVLVDLKGEEPGVAFDAPDELADLVLYAAAETADDLLAGRDDFAAALRRRALQSRADAVEVLRAASVLKALRAA
jgi:hypothetical protein